MATTTVRTSVAATAALGMLLAATGCASKPTARIAGVSLKDISLTSATLLFDVEVSNPYPVPLPLVNVDYELASRDAAFLSDKADIQGSVPAGGAKTVALPATVSYAGLLKVLQGVRPGAVIPYTANLGLSVNAPVLGAVRLPLKKEGQLPVPAPPQVAVSQVKWDQIGLDRAGGTVALALVNRNQFAVNLAKLTYALSLAGVEVGDGAMAKPVNLAADGGAGTLEIPISFSPRKAGLAFFRTLTGQGAGYSFKGALQADTPFGPMTLPVEKAGQTIFRR